MSRLMRASAFAQRRICRVVAYERATARTHIQTARVRGCSWMIACWGLYALEDQNGLVRCPCWLRQLLLERSDGHHAVQVRIEDGRDRHHHAELRRSRGHVHHYTMSRIMRASAFAQRRLCRVVANDHATARTHPDRACQGLLMDDARRVLGSVRT